MEFSYALTWSKWLMDRLEDCCNELADDLNKIQEDNADTVNETNLQLASVLEDLFTFKGEESEEILAFAGRMRDAFDAAKDDPESDIEDIDTEITYMVPPANCQ
jgi:hypothetical protein